MDINFSAPLSSLRTTFQREDVSAHNIANINTKGYEEQTLQQGDVLPHGVTATGISRRPNLDYSVSNVDLAQQMKEQLVNKDLVATDMRVIRAKDRMLGTLLDIVA